MRNDNLSRTELGVSLGPISMRLMDMVAQARGCLRIDLPARGVFELPGVAALGPSLAATPIRYILDHNVSALAGRTAFGEVELMLECLDLIRLPAPRIWIEWCEASRAAVLSELGYVTRLMPSQMARAGFLVSSDESGRRGEVDIAWSTKAGVVELSPLKILFDLDDPDFAHRGPGWALGVADHAAFHRLYGHARFVMRPAWSAYYRRCAKSGQDIWQANLQQLGWDFPLLCASALILQTRNALAYEASDLTRLNKARLRSGKPALLDHIEVSAHLDGARGDGGPPDGARREARRHFVCGHLVRRQGAIFWRRAHMRGNAAVGVVRARNLRLSMRNPARAHASIQQQQREGAVS
jgi:hypothetical protein